MFGQFFRSVRMDDTLVLKYLYWLSCWKRCVCQLCRNTDENLIDIQTDDAQFKNEERVFTTPGSGGGKNCPTHLWSKWNLWMKFPARTSLKYFLFFATRGKKRIPSKWTLQVWIFANVLEGRLILHAQRKKKREYNRAAAVIVLHVLALIVIMIKVRFTDYHYREFVCVCVYKLDGKICVAMWGNLSARLLNQRKWTMRVSVNGLRLI